MKIKNKLEIILKTPNANGNHLEIIESGDFISRFCGNLQLSREIQRAATTIGMYFFSTSVEKNKEKTVIWRDTALFASKAKINVF